MEPATLSGNVFRTPVRQRVAEVLFALFFLVPGTPAFLFLVFIVGAMTAGRWHVPHPLGCSLGLVALAAATIAAVIGRFARWRWQIGMGDVGVVVSGLGREARVGYDDIEFITTRPTAWDERHRSRWRAGRRRGLPLVPLDISTSGRHLRVTLEAGDAQDCLVALHERCLYASALDIDDRPYVPRDPIRRTQAGATFTSEAHKSAVLGVALSLVVLVLAGFLAAYTHGLLQPRSGSGEGLWVVLFWGALGAAWWAFVRYRRYTGLARAALPQPQAIEVQEDSDDSDDSDDVSDAEA